MTTTQPNVIVFLTDDQGYGDLSIFGNPDLQTPNIDRIGHEGLCLMQHYTGSPICAPARACFLTGRYNHRVGALSVESNRGLDRIALRESTIADLFKQDGYKTGMIGKWHNGLHDMRYHPNNRGFDEFAGFLNGGMDYWNWIIEYNSKSKRSDGRYLTDVFTEDAIDFIQRHKNEPFFLYAAYNAPHGPLQAPGEDIQPFTDLNKYTEAVWQTYGMIRRMDAGIGRILEALEQNGLDKNTIILYTSDNGPSPQKSEARYNGPFRGKKYDVLEGGIRVPGLIRWPAGLPQGEQFHDMLHFTDWMPTLLNACGIHIEPNCPSDGTDVLAALRGENNEVPNKRFWQFNRYDPIITCNATMRDGKWKLYWPRIPEAMQKLKADNDPFQKNFDVPHFMMDVSNPPVKRDLSLSGQPELYDINDDPHEITNLADQHPDLLNRMKAELETWFESVESDRHSIEIS